MTLRKVPTVDWLYDTDFANGVETAVHERIEVRGGLPDIFAIDIEGGGAVNDYSVMAEFPFDNYIAQAHDAVKSWYEKLGLTPPLYAVGIYNLLRSHFDSDPSPYYEAGKRLKDRGILKLIDCFIFDAYLTGNPETDRKIKARLPEDVANAQSLLLKRQKGYAVHQPIYVGGGLIPMDALAQQVAYCGQFFHGRMLWHDFDSRGCILCKPATSPMGDPIPGYDPAMVTWASQQWTVKASDGKVYWGPEKWWGRVAACQEVIRGG